MYHHYVLLIEKSFSVPVFCRSKKVKQSRNKLSVTQRVTGSLGSQISWYRTHEGGEFVSITHRPPLPPEMFLVLIFTKGWVDPMAMVRSEGIHWKNPVTTPGIDPGTVRLLEQRLNHYVILGSFFVVLGSINLNTSCEISKEPKDTFECLGRPWVWFSAARTKHSYLLISMCGTPLCCLVRKQDCVMDLGYIYSILVNKTLFFLQ